MKKYRLKPTALTPIHIGTGEVNEPTNYIIDNGFLYEFDEIDFYKALDEKSKQTFNTIVSKKKWRFFNGGVWVYKTTQRGG